jgi:SAM-dependent methyltransferase
MSVVPFDLPGALSINEKRRAVLERILTDMERQRPLKTALDVGCGFGYFADVLAGRGLQVLGVDARSENVAEAARRSPNIEWRVGDIEDPDTRALGEFDLVLCFGLLYHLENPFRAIRNLAALTRSVLICESVVAPTGRVSAVLYEENQIQDQALRYIALIPTEGFLVKCLYQAGFPFVYRARRLPDHHEFRAALWRHRRRTVLVASRTPLQETTLRLVPEPSAERYYLWYRLGLGALLRQNRLRELARAASRVLGAPGRRQVVQ